MSTRAVRASLARIAPGLMGFSGEGHGFAAMLVEAIGSKCEMVGETLP